MIGGGAFAVFLATCLRKAYKKYCPPRAERIQRSSSVQPFSRADANPAASGSVRPSASAWSIEDGKKERSDSKDGKHHATSELPKKPESRLQRVFRNFFLRSSSVEPIDNLHDNSAQVDGDGGVLHEEEKNERSSSSSSSRLSRHSEPRPDAVAAYNAAAAAAFPDFPGAFASRPNSAQPARVATPPAEAQLQRAAPPSPPKQPAEQVEEKSHSDLENGPETAGGTAALKVVKHSPSLSAAHSPVLAAAAAASGSAQNSPRSGKSKHSAGAIAAQAKPASEKAAIELQQGARADQPELPQAAPAAQSDAHEPQQQDQDQDAVSVPPPVQAGFDGDPDASISTVGALPQIAAPHQAGVGASSRADFLHQTSPNISFAQTQYGAAAGAEKSGSRRGSLPASRSLLDLTEEQREGLRLMVLEAANVAALAAVRRARRSSGDSGDEEVRGPVVPAIVVKRPGSAAPQRSENAEKKPASRTGGVTSRQARPEEKPALQKSSSRASVSSSRPGSARPGSAAAARAAASASGAPARVMGSRPRSGRAGWGQFTGKDINGTPTLMSGFPGQPVQVANDRRPGSASYRERAPAAVEVDVASVLSSATTEFSQAQSAHVGGGAAAAASAWQERAAPAAARKKSPPKAAGMPHSATLPGMPDASLDHAHNTEVGGSAQTILHHGEPESAAAGAAGAPAAGPVTRAQRFVMSGRPLSRGSARSLEANTVDNPYGVRAWKRDLPMRPGRQP